MVHFTIGTAATFWRTARAPAGFRAILRRVSRVFDFSYERANRLRRSLDLIDLYAAGMPVKDIQARFECSRFTVLRYARAAKLPVRDKGFAEKVKLATLAMYKSGRPIAEISARLGVSEAYVSKTATAEGINRRHFQPRRR